MLMTQPSQIIDFSKYYPPGVYTNPKAGPQLAVNSTLPSSVALFGLTVGYRTYTESLVINPDASSNTPAVNKTLAQKGINTSTVTVRNIATGDYYGTRNATTGLYTGGADYTIVSTGGTAGTTNAQYTISRVTSGAIPAQSTVQVSYQYTDPTYYAPTVFYSYADVVKAYGAPFNTTTGAIQSELTLGAKLAFINGATPVICVAVQPANPSAPTYSDYAAALDQLSDLNSVAIVVPCTGTQYQLLAAIKTHVAYQSGHRFERRAIIGLDGTATPVPSSTRINYASGNAAAGVVGLNYERIALVSPATFSYYAEELNDSVTIGGQYAAAALAGMVTNMSFVQPLTHKVLSGFNGVDDGGVVQLDAVKSAESQGGLMVVEQNSRGQIWVRHGVTTDNSDLIHREWNIIGQQDAMVYRLRDYLNNANLIGQPIYDYTLVNIKASAEAALQSLVRDALIVNYTGLACRQLLSNPDVIEISFSWLPAFGLNYIVLTFGISLSGYDTTVNPTVGVSGSMTANGANYTSNSPNVKNFNQPQSSINDFGGPSNTLMSS